jgi:hypothetical protein
MTQLPISHPGATRFKRLSIPDAEIDRILGNFIAVLNGQVTPSPDGLLLTPSKITRVTAQQAAAILDEGRRKPRAPSIRKLVEQAEKAGKNVTSITTPDGTKLDFGEADRATNFNPWDRVLPNASKIPS